MLRDISNSSSMLLHLPSLTFNLTAVYSRRFSRYIYIYENPASNKHDVNVKVNSSGLLAVGNAKVNLPPQDGASLKVDKDGLLSTPVKKQSKQPSESESESMKETVKESVKDESSSEHSMENIL